MSKMKEPFFGFMVEYITFKETNLLIWSYKKDQYQLLLLKNRIQNSEANLFFMDRAEFLCVKALMKYFSLLIYNCKKDYSNICCFQKHQNLSTDEWRGGLFHKKIVSNSKKLLLLSTVRRLAIVIIELQEGKVTCQSKNVLKSNLIQSLSFQYIIKLCWERHYILLYIVYYFIGLGQLYCATVAFLLSW